MSERVTIDGNGGALEFANASIDGQYLRLTLVARTSEYSPRDLHVTISPDENSREWVMNLTDNASKHPRVQDGHGKMLRMDFGDNPWYDVQDAEEDVARARAALEAAEQRLASMRAETATA
jgi:hypothetical protein